MKVVMVSKGSIRGTYQTKLEAMARHPDIDLTVIVPPSWNEGGGITLEKVHTEGYDLIVEPIRFNGKHHLHFYPNLGNRLRGLRPDIVHMDEEPYSFVTWRGLQVAKSLDAKFLFFSWQNIYRNYPPPFSLMEGQVLKQSDYAIVGNGDSAEVWRKKGFTGPIKLIPQFGVSTDTFKPAPSQNNGTFVMGTAGRIEEGKGIDLLFQAASKLDDDWRIRIAGNGDAKLALNELAQELRITDRVEWLGSIGSAEMPTFLQSIDALVLPSRTTRTWKEQFGRILIEAMACERVVVGSDSGEIPHVIGDAGLIFPEDDAPALHKQLQTLQQSPQLRREFGEKGRQRVIENYTQTQIADQIVSVYRELCP